MTKKKLISVLLPLAAASLFVALLLNREDTAEYKRDGGTVFGTTYSMTYQSEEDVHADIVQTLADVDNSLSTFNDTSIISLINRNEEVKLNSHFRSVFNTAHEVSKETDGAFDITVAPLVNAWGFGFKSGKKPTREQVDSLLKLVGWQTVTLEGNCVKKQTKQTMLDCSAIAKGYGVDAVADMLRSKGVKNFMVEIGGEVVTQGKNPQGKAWKIGVVKPTDDSLSQNSELQQVLEVENMAMATSGNYRNFYIEGGKKYAHTINPKTGYPVQHNILSATVLGPKCTVCDAYATAFMVMGLEKTQAVLARHPELMAYIIYSDEKGENKVWCSPELKAQLRGES